MTAPKSMSVDDIAAWLLRLDSDPTVNAEAEAVRALLERVAREAVLAAWAVDNPGEYISDVSVNNIVTRILGAAS